MGELKDGTTIAEVAAAQNVDPQAIYDAYLVDLAARLDALVAAGRITQEEAKGLLAGGEKPRLGDCVDPRSWIRTGRMMVVGTAASGSRRADSHIRRS